MSPRFIKAALTLYPGDRAKILFSPCSRGKYIFYSRLTPLPPLLPIPSPRDRSYRVLRRTHKVRTYKEYHSVALRWNWDSPPTPHPQASVPLPPVSVGRGTLAGEKGVGGESQFRRGATLWYSLYVRTLWTYCSSC
jgi:hypothetical protein